MAAAAANLDWGRRGRGDLLPLLRFSTVTNQKQATGKAGFGWLRWPVAAFSSSSCPTVAFAFEARWLVCRPPGFAFMFFQLSRETQKSNRWSIFLTRKEAWRLRAMYSTQIYLLMQKVILFPPGSFIHLNSVRDNILSGWE